MPLASKKKKQTRKTLSTSSMTPTGSTKKSNSIYRHLGRSGMTLALGSFSPLKEIEKPRSEQDKKSNSSTSPELGRRKKPMEERMLSSCTSSSNDESVDEASTLKKKMKKLMRKTKGHRRNHSYSGWYSVCVLNSVMLQILTYCIL